MAGLNLLASMPWYRGDTDRPQIMPEDVLGLNQLLRIAAPAQETGSLSALARPGAATVNPLIAAQGAKIRASQSARPAPVPPQWLLEGLPMEGRATFLPFQDTAPGSVMNQRSLALPGVLAGAVNAFTAPGRAYSGSDPSFDPQYEAANLAMNMMGGSFLAERPAGSLGMGARLRGAEYDLPHSALLEINKRRGLATKAERRQIAESVVSSSGNPQQYAEVTAKLGQLNKDIASVIADRRSANLMTDPLVMDSNQLKMLSRYGQKYTKMVNDLIDAGSGKNEAIAAAFKQHTYDTVTAPRLEKAARMEEFYLSPEISKHWSADRREAIRGSAALNMRPDDAASSATLEAVVRNARKLGWTVEHTSKGGDKRASSRYVTSPDGSRTVRISDHDLPMTPQREFNHSQGRTGRWNDEIVTTDWRSTSMEEYMRRLLGADPT